MKNKPIGVFDSGIGGLTVVKEIQNTLPNENIIYLGDTARVPYGSRGTEIITEFAIELTQFLLKKDVKFLVVACNTISAICLEKIQEISPVPVIGVIKPAAKQIVDTTKNQRIAVIGTRATIDSSIYEKEIHSINPKIEVISRACPLFVSISEEGLGSSDIARLTAEYYLKDLNTIDTLHLGCTHYPLLKEVIHNVVGRDIKIIDSAAPTAKELKKCLEENNLLNEGSQASSTYLFTDLPNRLITTSNLFLGKDIINSIHKVNLS
ncbi:MAG: glutamate racemase [Patescibacteria group bacterium]|jgi:glutamate racemase|nr:glutamate racemase [Patescibacteria group bacterium]